MSKINTNNSLIWAVLLIFGFVFLHSPSYAKANKNKWQTHQNKDNIVILYRHFQETELLDINACLTTHGTPHQALEFLTSPNQIINWLDNIKSVEVVEQITPSRNIMSSTFKGMFLVKPRQAFVYSKIEVANNGKIKISQEDAGSNFITVKVFSLMQHQQDYKQILQVVLPHLVAHQ